MGYERFCQTGTDCTVDLFKPGRNAHLTDVQFLFWAWSAEILFRHSSGREWPQDLGPERIAQIAVRCALDGME